MVFIRASEFTADDVSDESNGMPPKSRMECARTADGRQTKRLVTATSTTAFMAAMRGPNWSSKTLKDL